MNQYERGKHAPDWLTVQKLAAALQVPAAYFYSVDDDVAELLVMFHGLSEKRRAEIIQAVKQSL